MSTSLQLFHGVPEIYPQYVTEYGPRFGRPTLGHQIVWTFPNGYGASVVLGEGTYGLEMAVLHGESLCYDSGVADDVIGWIESPMELANLLRLVKGLPVKADCSHRH